MFVEHIEMDVTQVELDATDASVIVETDDASCDIQFSSLKGDGSECHFASVRMDEETARDVVRQLSLWFERLETGSVETCKALEELGRLTPTHPKQRGGDLDEVNI